MALGPAGASFDPDKADNFEDVGYRSLVSCLGADQSTDGEAIRSQGCAFYSISLAPDV